MKFPLALGASLGAVLLWAALGASMPAWAQTPRCVANGDIVTFEGVASTDAQARALPPGWVLHLSRPICVLRRSRRAPVEKIFAIRIIGTPPPLGVPLQLTGKLLVGGTSPGPTMFAALAVISGRKLREAENGPPPAPSSGRISPSAPPQNADERCDAPPYGGSQTDYQAFVRRFSRVISPARILVGICNAKFGRSPRDGLHKLGFSDAKIESESTERLAAETIAALKTLVNTIE
jgi:hypothetical protein